MRSQPGFWRKCRVGFRWFRIATLLAVLALVCAFVWFNRVGLPEFLKRPLVEKLHARGVELNSPACACASCADSSPKTSASATPRRLTARHFRWPKSSCGWIIARCFTGGCKSAAWFCAMADSSGQSRPPMRSHSNTFKPICDFRRTTPGRSIIFKPLRRRKTVVDRQYRPRARSPALGNVSRQKNRRLGEAVVANIFRHARPDSF